MEGGGQDGWIIQKSHFKGDNSCSSGLFWCNQADAVVVVTLLGPVQTDCFGCGLGQATKGLLRLWGGIMCRLACSSHPNSKRSLVGQPVCQLSASADSLRRVRGSNILLLIIFTTLFSLSVSAILGPVPPFPAPNFPSLLLPLLSVSLPLNLQP